MQAAQAQPRTGSGSSSQRVGPALPSTGHQDEAIDLNEGKTPAQIFASDCAVCHQKPGELAGGRDAGQLATFLRQHYTTGVAQARILAAYVASLSTGRGQAERRLPERPEVGDGGRGLIGTLPNFMGIGRKPAEEAAPESGADKPREPAARTAKPADTKPAETKPADEAPAEAKPAEAKPADAKPADTKPADAKPAEVKPAEAKPADTKPADTKPTEAKPAEIKPAETAKPVPGAEPGKPAATAGAKPAAKPKDGAAGEKPSAGPAQQKPPARGSDIRI